MNLQDKVKFVERATWEAVVAREGQEVISTPEWVQLTSSFAPTAFMNAVLRCELPEAEIEKRVASTVAHFRSKKLPFRWKVVPSTRPAGLGKILEKHGLELKERLFGLYADASMLKIESNPQVRVEKMGLHNLEDWLTVQAKAWSVPPQGIAYQRKAMTEGLSRAGSPFENYVAYFEGQPAGSAALRIGDGYAYLMGGAVNEANRRQGIYRTLTAHRMERIAELGLPAVIHCLEKTSAPICLKLGFEKVCEIESYEPNMT